MSKTAAEFQYNPARPAAEIDRLRAEAAETSQP